MGPPRTAELPTREVGHLPNRVGHAGIDGPERLLHEAGTALGRTLRLDKLPDGRPRFVRHGTRPRTFVTRRDRIDLRDPRVRECLDRGTFAPRIAILRLGEKRYPRGPQGRSPGPKSDLLRGSPEVIERESGPRIPVMLSRTSSRRSLIVERALHVPSAPAPAEPSLHEVDSTFLMTGGRRGDPRAIRVANTKWPIEVAHLYRGRHSRWATW